MEEILKEYKLNGQFDFEINSSLASACNAPKDKGGIYLVYEVTGAIEKIIYIGSTGWVNTAGTFHIRKDGMYDRLVNGNQFDEPRKKGWPKKMKVDKIDLIRVKWYVTFGNDLKHIPAYTEACCLQKYFEENKCIPDWNTDF